MTGFGKELGTERKVSIGVGVEPHMGGIGGRGELFAQRGGMLGTGHDNDEAIGARGAAQPAVERHAHRQRADAAWASGHELLGHAVEPERTGKPFADRAPALGA